MAALKSEVKSFIVQALACFDTPSQVAEAVKNEFGVVLSRQQVENRLMIGRPPKTSVQLPTRTAFSASKTWFSLPKPRPQRL